MEQNTYDNIIENALHKWIVPNKKNHDYFLEEKNIKFEHKSVTYQVAILGP